MRNINKLGSQPGDAMFLKPALALLGAILVAACQTTYTGSEWIPVEKGAAKIQLTGIFEANYIQRHLTRINASRQEEYLSWYDGDQRLSMLYYQLPSNTFFAQRMDLQRVAELSALNLVSPTFTSELETFHNAVDLVEYKFAKSGSWNCIIFSMAFGVKSFVSASDPVGTIWAVGTYCQTQPIDNQMARIALSGLEFKGWTKYPENTAAYLSAPNDGKSSGAHDEKLKVFSLSESDETRSARFIGSWAGVKKELAGVIRFTKGSNRGKFSTTAEDVELNCSGNWTLDSQGSEDQSKPTTGTFEGVCSNKQTISGRLTMLSPGTGVAEGKDQLGRVIRLSYN